MEKFPNHAESHYLINLPSASSQHTHTHARNPSQMSAMVPSVAGVILACVLVTLTVFQHQYLFLPTSALLGAQLPFLFLSISYPELSDYVRAHTHRIAYHLT